VLFTHAACMGYMFLYHVCMAKIIGYHRNNSNSSNKTLAKQFRDSTIKPIKAIGARSKPAYRARRSDYGQKRS